MNWRYRFTFFSLVLVFLMVISRLFYWQVVKAEELTLAGKTQYGRTVKIFPKRGSIQTSDKYPIATNKISYLVFANPKEIPDKEKVIDVLSPLLEVEKATLSAQLNKNLFWVPLKSKVEDKIKEEIEKNKLRGIGFEEQSLRFYPEASMAAQLVGFVGKNEAGEDKGYFGLEGYYDRQLRGKEGIAVQINDALGRPILAKVNESGGQIDGRTLVLSIDRVIQFLLEKNLKKGIEQYEAAGVMAAVMDPKTGNIIAMASYPTFDPSHVNDFSSDYYKNPFISNAYEPGSTFKALVMAAGIDTGVVKPDTKCDICEGPVEIGEYKIKTWNDEYRKDITMADAIKYSDNTGMVFVSQKLGLDTMLEYFKKFGIGELTGIDLQGEIAPAIRDRDSWYPIDVATASFGQGIHITAIELLTAFSAIANEGNMMEPHVVSKIIVSDSETIPIEPKIVGKPISAKTAKVMTEILVKAVDNGEAKYAKPKGYRIAGKTGTAQIPIAGHYDANKTIASFIGFAPADNPKFVMLVVVDRPTTSIYGAETAAPIFFNVARDIFSYLEIPPTQ